MGVYGNDVKIGTKLVILVLGLGLLLLCGAGYGIYQMKFVDTSYRTIVRDDLSAATDGAAMGLHFNQGRVVMERALIDPEQRASSIARMQEIDAQTDAEMNKLEGKAVSAEGRAAVQQLAAATQNMTVAYMDISQNVTDTLSYMDSIPSGNPVSKCVLTSLMGTRVDPIDGSVENHAGVDLSCSVGSAVEATASGTVIYSQYHSSYGYYIKIDHGNGYVTAYAHCSYLFAQVGDQVEKGDVIALSGATGQVTGPHLHYEVSLNGVYQDPLVYMDTENLPRQLG